MTDCPNILLVISDQQRTDTLGFLGRTPCRTPNMDRLAREGVSFDRAICASPLCLPSRASLFTGQYPHQINMMRNSDTIDVEPHLTDRLRQSGYHTAYAGKWHLEPDEQPKAFQGRAEALGLAEVHGSPNRQSGRRIDRWFDRAEGQGSYDYSVWCEAQGLPDGWPVSDDELRTDRRPSMSIPKVKRETALSVDQTYDGWVTDIALRFLDDRPKRQPFFLVCSWFAPHPPFKVPDPYFDMYDPADAGMPPNFRPGPGKPDSIRNSFFHRLWLDHGDDWDAWRSTVAAYWGYTSMVDALLGRLLGRLDEERVLDDTLVVFCSDHGEMLGSHGLWHKMAPYEECLRVPLLMRFPPRFPAGRRSASPVSLLDVPSTILAAAGCELPDRYQGVDLGPLARGETDAAGEPVRFAEMRSLGDWHGISDFRLVVDERHKFVWHDGDRPELYDLQRDPFEQINLADTADARPVRRRLSDRLQAWMTATDDPLADRIGAGTQAVGTSAARSPSSRSGSNSTG